jgi:hypothetical protein
MTRICRKDNPVGTFCAVKPEPCKNNNKRNMVKPSINHQRTISIINPYEQIPMHKNKLYRPPNL